jgi:hypothetical protein
MLRKAGLQDLEVIDARDLGHNVWAMFERHLVEILTTFVNCTSEARIGSPKIDPPGGVFAGPVKVTLTAPGTGMKLFYSKDGSDPQQGQEYTGPVKLDKPCLLRVVGVLADGKPTRQRLVRFDIRSPLSPNAKPGKNKGLAFEVVEGTWGKQPLSFLRQALGGKSKRIDSGVVESFAFPEVATKKLASRDGTAIFRGVLTVPESGVYRFQIIGPSAGLYLEDGKGGLVKLIHTVGPDTPLEVSVPLGKGSHRVLAACRLPQPGREPIKVLLRNGSGAFAPIPAVMLSY